MLRRTCLWTLAALLLAVAPARAHFLFIRITPQAEAGRFADVFFSDRPDVGDPQFVAKIAATHLWLQSEPGDFQPLKTLKTNDRLRAHLPPTGALAVVGHCDYGVLARPGKTAFLLRHFPKAIAGDPQRLAQLTPKAGLPLELVASIDGDRCHFTALHDGKPLPGAEITLVDLALQSTKLRAGDDGKATWTAAPGTFAAYLGQTTKKAGVHDGKKYDEVRDFCSLCFTWPLEPAGDAAALKLFRDAVAARATWTKFPGFTADVEAYVEGHSASGAVTVSAGGEVTVSTMEEIVSPWIKDRLDSIVLHRLAAAPDNSTPTVFFGDQDLAHPLGRLVVFQGGQFASSYRIKDHQLMVVNRQRGKANFTITILENDVNAEGKVLPRSYTVQYWDAVTGQLQRTEAVQERWQRVAGLDVPVLQRVTEASPAGLLVRTLRLSGHKVPR